VKTAKQVGIAGYGAYVPRLRMLTEDIAEVWRPKGAAKPPVPEKGTPGLDEDSATMAIEAARNALRRSGVSPSDIGAIWVGTESKPYAAKPTATLVAAALGAGPRIMASDVEFACKSGTEAMQMATAAVGSGMVSHAMAIGVDVAQARPGDVLEVTTGCGGAAFMFASVDESLASVDGSVSFASDTADFFRRAGAIYPQHGGRFTEEPGYFRHTLAASRLLLQELKLAPADFAYAVFHQPVPKLVERAARELGFTGAQMEPGFCALRMANAYAGSSCLGLAAVLDQAKPGDRIFFCSYGSGAGSDAFAFTATDRIAARRGSLTVAKYLDRRQLVSGYGQYLRLTGRIRM
jgi:hydroxymethylglutaryl-CoA synthase